MLYYDLTEMQYHCAALQFFFSDPFFRQIDFDNSAKFLSKGLDCFSVAYCGNSVIFLSLRSLREINFNNCGASITISDVLQL